MKPTIRISIVIFSALCSLFVLSTPVFGAISHSQIIILKPGWNIVSTPRVLESHSFSAAETSTNFDIFVLDASKPSGWATLSDLGQSEFTPLYGYFINNKTGTNQTLTFNHKVDVPPNERLFDRTFAVTGWYSIGVANPSYAKEQLDDISDTNNVDPILNSLLGTFSYYSTVIDFADASLDAWSVDFTDPWKAVERSTDVSNTIEINKLKDFRETKGYAIFIKQAGALYSGFQNNDIPMFPQCADGLDNDLDGEIDYPNDPDCVSLSDDDEAATAPGSYTVIDDDTPGYRVVSANTTGVTLARLKFSAEVEDIDIKRIALQLSDTDKNSSLDLTGSQVTLWDETANKQIATALFTDNGDLAISSLIATGDFRVTKNGSRMMLVKGDIANISAVGPMTASGELLKVDYDGDRNGLSDGNYGIGVGSGTNISPSSSDTTVAGVRIFKAYPILSKIDMSSSDKLLQNGSARPMYKFKITADNDDVAIYKFSFVVGSSTKSATTSSYGLYVYTDSAFSSIDTSFSNDGLLNYGNCYAYNNSQVEIYMDKGGIACGTKTVYVVPHGQTRYFKLTANVSNVETGSGTETIENQLAGDSAYPSLTTAMGNAAEIDSDINNDFIWSPISVDSSVLPSDIDWSNGYYLPGLPLTNMPSESLESAN